MLKLISYIEHRHLIMLFPQVRGTWHRRCLEKQLHLTSLDTVEVSFGGVRETSLACCCLSYKWYQMMLCMESFVQFASFSFRSLFKRAIKMEEMGAQKRFDDLP